MAIKAGTDSHKICRWLPLKHTPYTSATQSEDSLLNVVDDGQLDNPKYRWGGSPLNVDFGTGTNINSYQKTKNYLTLHITARLLKLHSIRILILKLRL